MTDASSRAQARLPFVPPGTGWPGDPATPSTPVAATPAEVQRLAAAAESLTELDALVSVCRACPRLVQWREQVALERRRVVPAPQLAARMLGGLLDLSGQVVEPGDGGVRHRSGSYRSQEPERGLAAVNGF